MQTQSPRTTMVLRSQEMSIPLDVVERGMHELSTGVRITIEISVGLWRAKRIPACELELLLSSVAWQSETLSDYFNGRQKGRLADCAVLSDEDMAALMNGQCEVQGPAKRGRATTTCTEQACSPAPQCLATAPVHPPSDYKPDVELSFEILSSEDMLALMGGGQAQCDVSASITDLPISSSVKTAGMKTVVSSNSVDDMARFW